MRTRVRVFVKKKKHFIFFVSLCIFFPRKVDPSKYRMNTVKLAVLVKPFYLNLSGADIN